MKRLLLFIAVIALLALASGCGSSSSSSPSTGASTGGEAAPGKAAFIAEADMLCAATKQEEEPLTKQVGEAAQQAQSEEQSGAGIAGATRKALAGALGKLATISESGSAELEALAAPGEDKSKLEAIFQKIEAASDDSRAYGEALENTEDAKAQAIAEHGDAETQSAGSLARSYGFKVCATAP